NPRTKNWSYFLLDKLEIPKCIFADIIQPGKIIGSLEPNLANDLGISNEIDVVAPASHDTGSAIAAIPASSDGFAYLSSGTWSLMGVELKEPVLSKKAYAKDFTNEGGVNGTIRFLRNIMGLWIVQEIRKTWLAEGDDISYAEMTSLAGELNHSESLINPDSPEFLPPGNMPQRVKDFCSRTNQKVPETKAEIVRCVLDSLAFKYRSTLEDLEEVLEKRLDPLHIVGGGTQNKLLSQLTANAIGRNVIAGPVEATAIGNLLVQAMGKGVVSSLEEIRTIVSNSFEVETFIPKPHSELEESYKKFLDICNQ
ncbi:MAG: FGGY-family carbohydrate kinase, partial [Armatimonadota bacterium]